MRVLHGVWSSEAGRFYVWAEQPPGPRRGRASTAARRPHPFAVDGGDLAAALGRKPGGAQLLLSLPTHEGRPLPGPELSRHLGTEGVAGEASLVEWKVPAVELEPVAALEWLAGDPGFELADAAGLRYWRTAARFALGLLHRQRYLPGLVPGENGRQAARWEPALNQPEDAARFRALLEGMPPACRAMVEANGPPSRSALLRSFLGVTLDAAIRSWSDAPAPTDRSGDAAATWLAALVAPQGEVRERAENLRPLAASLQTWRQPVAAAGAAGFRTCFRLDPPALETDGIPWYLSFWLQAIDEPSLLVPAASVWQNSKGSLAALGRDWEAPQERMLPALARAARLFPPVEHALRQKAPEGSELSTPEAYQFLREVAPLLEETGNGVLTPDWWRKPAARLGVKVRMRSAPSAAKGVLTQEKLVQFDWELAIGDEPLTPQEFAQLASLKSPLVRLRGKWLEVHHDEVERAIRAWERRKAGGPIGLLEALQLQEGDAEGLPVTEIEVEGELQALFARLQGDERPDPVPVPEQFHGTLRPYQQYGLEWLAFLRQWRLGACLADDMGLGKTVQVLAYLLHSRGDEERSPVLLVGPTSLLENWRREAARFAPSLKVYLHHGAQRVRGVVNATDPESPEEPSAGPSFADAVAGHDLVVTTYPLALRDEAALRTVSWDTVILDEAQNIKNPGTGQTRAIRSLPAGIRIAMTGTPVENRLTDLWSIMEFLNPGFLGSERGFRRQYAVAIERDHDVEASERLRRLTHPFVLRRVKTDPTVIQDLPDKLEMKVTCTLTSEQATLYEAAVRELLEQVDEAEGIQRRGLVLSTLSRLKQICNHPAQFLHDSSALPGRSGKLERLVEMLEEVFSVGEAALVFSQFAEMGELLQAHLQATFKQEALFLHGGVPRKKRDELVTRFQSPDGPPVMILSLKAGGVGLNLTRASHVFHFDRWWNPAVENQATDRAFRIGQTRTVQVHKFLCAGTLEDQIDQMIEQKQELARTIVGGGEEWLTELSTAQLRDLVRLRKDVIGGA